MNPVDSFLLFCEELDKEASSELKGKQQRELQLWKTWHESGRKPEHLRPLLQSLKPFINSQVNMWANRIRDIPPAAIKAEFMTHVVKALETYDPSKAALNTHIGNRLKKAQRFVTTYQNPARIPESRIYKIRTLENATEELTQKLGREPTQLELADHLKWSPRHVDYLQREVRRAIPESRFSSDPYTTTQPEHQEVLRLLPYELDHEERLVFEYLYGTGGKPKLEPGQIAKRLNMSPSKVSKLKKSIADKYSKYTS